MRCFTVYGCLLLMFLAWAPPARAENPTDGLPRVFSISPRTLAETRARARADDQSLQPALKRLKQEAAKALKVAPVSVMDKKRAAPSGDKHDYLSLGPYWWPDPKKKDGLPYIRRDGEVNPESRTGTDRPAMERMASSVQTLALAYYLTGNEAYARHAATLLRTWFLDPATRMNPHLNYGQGIPGRCEGRAAGIIDTHLLVGIVDAAGMLESSPAWTPQDRRGMVAWCEAFLRWLRTSKIGLGEAKAANNHGTWYDAQVAVLALYTGQDRVARETLEAAERRRIDAQIEPDGSQPHELARTKSFGYSLFNLRALCALAALGERAGVDLWNYRSQDGRSIRAALDALAEYARPEKKWPHKEMHFTRSGLVPVLLQASAVYRAPRYQRLLEAFPAHEAAAHRARLLYCR